MSSHDHDTAYGESHGTVRYYIIGFILSIVLTVIPYVLVTQHILDSDLTIFSIIVAGILQLVVQLVFFLHLGSESKPRWNLMAFIFTIVIVGILVVGSLWIMHNLDYNMMDHTMMENMP